MASKRKCEDIDDTEDQPILETETTTELETTPSSRSDDPGLNSEHIAPPDNSPESNSPCKSPGKSEITAQLEPRPSCSQDDPGFYYEYICTSSEYESPDEDPGMRVLRHTITDNELAQFIVYVWNNPELLYNGDGTLPFVVENGEQYNLMQYAVISNNALLCQLILDILEHPMILKGLFPVDVDEYEARARMTYIISLYLNSQSSSGETPLHYAAEHGLLNCCRILLSHPFCDVHALTNEGFPMNEVICMKASGRTSLLFNIIEEHFVDGMLYVPVYRSCRGSRPLVGKPTQCREFNSVILNPEISSGFPANERQLYYLNAFAGPMSRKKAEIFYTALKCPSDSHLFTLDEKNTLEQIKREELERGIERIGRNMSKEMGIEWKEFFPTLNVFTNLAADEGLEILETFITYKRNGYSFSVLPAPDSDSIIAFFFTLLNLHKPHSNPLCHRANSLYCYHKKFIAVEVVDDVENEVKFAPAEPCRVPFPVIPASAVPVGSSPSMGLNGVSLTDLDRDVHVAVKRDFDPARFPEVSHWIEKIGEQLQIEYARAGINGNPIPVPKPHN